ncbi:MAG: hypothetical protein AAGJ18_04010 [Bacteroidota bacterium]
MKEIILMLMVLKDTNGNGEMEYEELTNIFWIDLKNTKNNGVQFEGK